MLVMTGRRNILYENKNVKETLENLVTWTLTKEVGLQLRQMCYAKCPHLIFYRQALLKTEN